MPDVVLRFLNRMFPHHSATVTIRNLQWKPYDPHDDLFRGVTDIYDVERRMRQFLMPYC
jgi:hypothetical protein